MSVRFLVVRKRDDSAPEVYPFESREYAEQFYTRAAAQWSETFLCEVIKPLYDERGVLEAE